MISAVASCAGPPLLLPGITGRPVVEVEQLRAACLAAIAELLASGPDQVLVVGGTSATELEPANPLSVRVGRLLLSQAAATVPIEQLVVAETTSTLDCLEAGRACAPSGRVGLLVVADGSARRSVKAPGYFDERAAAFDASIETALADGEPAGLAALDPALAADLLVAGRAAWQLLAGATEGRRFAGRLHYSDDPFGVWYPVASWLGSQ